jgi:hypothetical protein
MLKITKQQIASLDDEIAGAFARDLVRYLRAEHADAVRALDDAELLRRVHVGVARAEAYGMTWDATITAFVAMMFEIAPTFDEQPGIARVLHDERVPPDTRVDALWDRTTEEDWDEAERYAARAESFWASVSAQEEAPAP